ncbi:hypothetical protein PENTCL1PPCAC_12347, partial [Pristionchus entomophagus]
PDGRLDARAMRMKFIVLIWALAAFTTAQIPTPIGRQCGGIYMCLVPEYCVDGTTSLNDSLVQELRKTTTKVNDNCPAIIRFHAYAKYWLVVSIESLIGSTQTIVFTQTKKDGISLKSEFSCAADNNVLKGKFKNTNLEKVLVTSEYTPSMMIKCDFIVKLEETEEIFEESTTAENLYFTVNGRDTLRVPSNLKIPTMSCDPSRFDYQLDITDETKTYNEVKYKPGEYYCDNIYQMQYRAEGSPKYTEGVKLTCEREEFLVDGFKIPEGEEFKIRCAADAKFFCDFDIKAPPGKDQWELNKRSSDKSAHPPIQSKIGCPPAFPHLIIGDTPILYPEFTCKNFGSTRAWTIKGSTDYITEEGPEVYCTNEVTCHSVNSISESIVEGGTLDKNFLPTCLGDDELLIGDKNVTGVRCDKLSGKFKYTVDGEEKDITIDTQFNCYHKQKENNEKNNENKKKITHWSLYGIGGCFGVLFLILIFAACYTSIGMKLDERKIMKAQGADYRIYGMNSEEKKAYELKKSKWNKNKKQQQPQPSSSDKLREIDSWNDMLQWLRHKCASGLTASNEGNSAFSVKPYGFSDADEMFNECGPFLLKNSKKTIGKIKIDRSEFRMEEREAYPTKGLKEEVAKERRKRGQKLNSKN